MTTLSMPSILQPPFLVYPWNAEEPGATEDAMVGVYHRMKKEGLYDICFHENPTMTFSGFMRFFTRPNTLVQFCIIVDDEGHAQELAGLTWLSEFEELPTHRRATGSFCFFRDYWDPKWTTGFAIPMMKFWFDELRLDILVGMTPVLNRQAMSYCKRIGFRYTAALENYTSFKGRQCAAGIAVMTRKDYAERYLTSNGDMK